MSLFEGTPIKSVENIYLNTLTILNNSKRGVSKLVSYISQIRNIPPLNHLVSMKKQITFLGYKPWVTFHSILSTPFITNVTILA